MILMKGSMVLKEALFSLRVIGKYIQFLNSEANGTKKMLKNDTCFAPHTYKIMLKSMFFKDFTC